MTFKDWLSARGLSDSTAYKYDRAIRGVISQWAMDAGLLESSLDAIESIHRFKLVAAQLRELPIYRERNERGNSMYSNALNKFSEYLAEGFVNDVETDIDSILKQDVAETEKSALLLTRIGQGSFRQKLITYWNGCAITKYKDCSLLVASHIKPWRASSNSERLDCFNGLLLLPNLDKVFDRGMISFDEAGAIKLSPLLESPSALGIRSDMKINLEPRHRLYIKYHRNEVFLK